MRILIKGAGDLATGIASRLYYCGHQILMTEIAVPLTVRRKAALSRAVYEERADVEDMSGVLAHSIKEVYEIQADGKVAVIVDEEAKIREEYAPDIIIDAILAKKNLGTKIIDGPFVIGVGPGFSAGVDCHCVVETKRGHTLGTVIWKGTAIPNTGIPGEVGGYTTERLIRASADGVLEAKVSIGDVVEKGRLVAVTGGKPVYAQMPGIVRGMLQNGVYVKESLKIGDIDARCETLHCRTVSDKAKAIGGGVLEAVGIFEHMRGKYAVVVLAAGNSSRFGENKLTALVKGKPMYVYMLEKLKAFPEFFRVLVTQYPEIAGEAEKNGVQNVMNTAPELGISHSLKLGLSRCLDENPDLQGVLFAVCDQPGLQVSTIQQILNTALVHKGKIICAGYQGKSGNPVFWDRCYFKELQRLGGDQGGRQLLKQYHDKVILIETDCEELKDIDYKADFTE